jgi:hypothetical protein
MKNLILIIIGFAFITSCNKQSYASQGEITAIDGRKCASPCCGGWFFTTGGRELKVQQFPSNIDFDPIREPLPIQVEFDLESGTPICDGATKLLTFKRIRKMK